MQQPPQARELPLSYLMTLAGNSEAMRYYSAMLPETKRAADAGQPPRLYRLQMQPYQAVLAKKPRQTSRPDDAAER